MELHSQQENVIVHYKDGIRVAATFRTPKIEMMKVTESTQTDIEDFYEANLPKDFPAIH